MALLFGLLTAFFWGSSAVVGARVVRSIGALAGALWMTLVGTVLVAPVALIGGLPHAPVRAWLFAAAAGILYLLGTGCWMLGVKGGHVGIVTTLVSTDGAIAAAIAVALGEALGAATGVAIVVIVAGLVLATRPARSDEGPLSASAVGFGLVAAASFGGVFVLGAHATALGAVWVVLVARITSATLIAPHALRGRPRFERALWPAILYMAVGDVAGYGFFLVGSRHGIAVTSVLASQYALVAVVLGRVVFGERLSRLQLVGVALTIGGVGALAIVRG